MKVNLVDHKGNIIDVGPTFASLEVDSTELRASVDQLTEAIIELKELLQLIHS